MPAINGDCFQIKRTSTILQLPAVVTRTTHRRPHSLSTDAASTVALAACKCVRLICQKVVQIYRSTHHITATTVKVMRLLGCRFKVHF
jgi:hypothetical protein